MILSRWMMWSWLISRLLWRHIFLWIKIGVVTFSGHHSKYTKVNETGKDFWNGQLFPAYWSILNTFNYNCKELERWGYIWYTASSKSIFSLHDCQLIYIPLEERFCILFGSADISASTTFVDAVFLSTSLDLVAYKVSYKNKTNKRELEK